MQVQIIWSGLEDFRKCLKNNKRYTKMFFSKDFGIRKNTQVVTDQQTRCYTNLFINCRQVVFALLVPSCWNKFGTNC
jgi:hypothetical protein